MSVDNRPTEQSDKVAETVNAAVGNRVNPELLDPYRIQFSKRLTLPNIFASVIALAYVLGYLIHTLYTRNLGIENLSLLKAEFLEVGFVFMILSLTLLTIPLRFLFISEIYKARRRKSQGAILNTLIYLNFSSVTLYFVLFTRYHDWHKNVLFDFTMGHIFLLLILIFFLAVGISLFEDYFLNKYPNADNNKRNVLFVLRLVALALSIWVDYYLFYSITQRLKEIFYAMRYYLPLLITFGLILYRIKQNQNFYHSNPSIKVKLIVLSSIFSIVLCYLIVVSYAYGIYKVIPMDRGGKLPVSYATISLDKDYVPMLDGIKNIDNIDIYIIEHTADSIYFIKKITEYYQEPQDKYLIYNLRRASISSMVIHPHHE